MRIECLGSVELDAATLWADHPPRFHDDRKRELIARITAPVTGSLHVSRWHAVRADTTESPPGTPTFELATHAFDYPPDAPGAVAWHLNFADASLFVAYASSLLAQDELQVLEHPILGSLREALLARSDEPRPSTRGPDGRPRPILVRGAQRSLTLDTSGGLYGNAFARADPGRIAAATTFLDPPTFTNVLAVEAPPGGFGPYDRATIADVLDTACIGFAAARQASAPAVTVIHTGGWGTGAYGGNKVLMALLQLCAARLVGVDRLVYHTLTDGEPFRAALGLLDGLPWGASAGVDALVDAVLAHGFEWGVSDGN